MHKYPGLNDFFNNGEKETLSVSKKIFPIKEGLHDLPNIMKLILTGVKSAVVRLPLHKCVNSKTLKRYHFERIQFMHNSQK